MKPINYVCSKFDGNRFTNYSFLVVQNAGFLSKQYGVTKFHVPCTMSTNKILINKTGNRNSSHSRDTGLWCITTSGDIVTWYHMYLYRKHSISDTCWTQWILSDSPFHDWVLSPHWHIGPTCYALKESRIHPYVSISYAVMFRLHNYCAPLKFEMYAYIRYGIVN